MSLLSHRDKSLQNIKCPLIFIFTYECTTQIKVEHISVTPVGALCLSQRDSCWSDLYCLSVSFACFKCITKELDTLCSLFSVSAIVIHGVDCNSSFLTQCHSPSIVQVDPFNVDEYLDCFQFMVIMNKIAIKSLVFVFQ